MVDLHTHLLPGVDDGARTADEAREALSRLQKQGVRAVVATPHLSAGLAERDQEAWWARLDAFSLAEESLRACAGSLLNEIQLERGVELRLDSPPRHLWDRRLRLAGSRFILVEFTSLQLPAFGDRALARVTESGWVPVLAHPERYRGLARNARVVEAWRDSGALLQVNAGSLLGQYGTGPRKVAWALLAMGWVDMVSSDYHSRDEPQLKPAREQVARRGDAESAELLFDVNPGRILEDLEPEAVPPMERSGWWRRFKGSLGLEP